MSANEDATSFGELFPAVYHRFHRVAEKSEPEFSPESLAVLRHLSRSGPLTVSEASLHFDRSQSAMSEILARLERRGLLERIADERDRRRTLVWLTDTGAAALEAATSVLCAVKLSAAMAQMSSENRSHLLAGMTALLATSLNPTPGEES